MIRRARRGGFGDDERILPLINIVFLLLIFFMLAGRLSASDPIEVTPPDSTTKAPATPGNLTVFIGRDGRVALGDQVLETDVLVERVKTHIADAPSTQIRVKADARAEVAGLIALLQQLGLAGVGSIELLTVAKAQAL